MGKKILILTPFYPPNIGGAESFVAGLVKAADGEGHEVTVLTFKIFSARAKGCETILSSDGNVNIWRMEWPCKLPTAWKGLGVKNFLAVFPKMFLTAWRINAKNKYNIIHAQGLISGLIAVLLKRIFRVKVFLTLLALYEFDKKPKWFCWIARWMFQNCDCIFVEGMGGAQDAWGAYRKFFKHMGDVKKRAPNFITFNHWVDQTIFKPPENRPNDKIRVLFIGRPTPEKGRHIVEEAERILNDKEKYEFVYVENSPLSDLPKYYQMAHIVVVPSLYAEGFSRVVAEAASCGCAVIVSRMGSLEEMVRNFGIVTEPTPSDIEYWIRKISPDVLSYGQIAHRYALKNFSPTNAEVFLNEYSK